MCRRRRQTQTNLQWRRRAARLRHTPARRTVADDEVVGVNLAWNGRRRRRDVSALRNQLFSERAHPCRRVESILPPHFYGVMAKTELGCQVLQEKGHFSEFAQFIRRHGLEHEDQDLILKLKSVLWAVVSGASLFVGK